METFEGPLLPAGHTTINPADHNLLTAITRGSLSRE